MVFARFVVQIFAGVLATKNTYTYVYMICEHFASPAPQIIVLAYDIIGLCVHVAMLLAQ